MKELFLREATLNIMHLSYLEDLVGIEGDSHAFTSQIKLNRDNPLRLQNVKKNCSNGSHELQVQSEMPFFLNQHIQFFFISFFHLDSHL